jgi:hypothetical protein
MGRVHFVPLPDGHVKPFVWRSPFPVTIQRQLVSFANSWGDVSNSELTLAASVAQHDFPAQLFAVCDAPIHSSSENVIMVWWKREEATARILRLQSLYQHHYCYVPLFDYTMGGEYRAQCL